MKVFVNIEATEKELPRLAQALLTLSPENGVVATVARAEEPRAAAPAAPAPEKKAAAPKGGKKAAAKETPAEAPPVVDESAARDALLGDAPAKAAAPSIADVRAAVEAYAAKKGFPAAREIVGRFGAERVADIPEGKRAEFLEAVKL